MNDDELALFDKIKIELASATVTPNNAVFLSLRSISNGFDSVKALYNFLPYCSNSVMYYIYTISST